MINSPRADLNFALPNSREMDCDWQLPCWRCQRGGIHGCPPVMIMGQPAPERGRVEPLVSRLGAANHPPPTTYLPSCGVKQLTLTCPPLYILVRRPPPTSHSISSSACRVVNIYNPGTRYGRYRVASSPWRKGKPAPHDASIPSGTSELTQSPVEPRRYAVFIGLVVIAILCAASWFLAPKGENQVSVLSICPPPTGRRRRSLQPAVGAAQLSSPDPTC